MQHDQVGTGLAAPRTAGALHAWIRRNLGVSVPRRPLVAGNAAPFDYLRHAFFEPEGDGPLDCVVWAARGAGKTFLGAVATALDLVFKPGIGVRILGGSLEQSKRMHAHLRALFEAPALAPLLDGRITERRVRLHNGSEAELLAQSHHSVRGTRVQKLRCDEVELFDPLVWEAAQLVTRSADCGGVPVRGAIECLSTMHVPFGLMHALVRDAGEARRTLVRWSVIDALEHCPDWRRCEACDLEPECRGRAKKRTPPEAGHVRIDDAIAQKRRVSAATWEAEMLCARPRRSDAVYPEFDPAVHVVADAPRADEPGVTWVAGMDFGYRCPTVVVLGAVRPDGALVIADEYVAAQRVLGAHIDAIRAGGWPPIAWIGADPAGRQTNDQTGRDAIAVLRSAGFVVKARPSRVHEGIELVRRRLRPAAGAPGLFVAARCQALIESLTRYHYPANNDRALEPVKDGSDHAADALRYLVLHLDRPRRGSCCNYVFGGR